MICLGDGGRLATRADVVVDKPLELLFNGSEGVGMNLEGVLRIALVDIGNITPLKKKANVKCDGGKTSNIIHINGSLEGQGVLACQNLLGGMSARDVSLGSGFDAWHVFIDLLLEEEEALCESGYKIIFDFGLKIKMF